MSKNLKIPTLRFKEFSGEWEEKNYGEIYTFLSTNSLSRDKLNYDSGTVKNIHYGDVHTKFNTMFNIKNEKVPFINSDIDLSKIKDENYCLEGDLVIADASEDYADIGKTMEIISLNNEKVISGLHTFLARPDKYDMALGYSGYLLQSWKVRKQVMIIAQGTKVLSLSTTRLSKIKLNLPQKQEQEKIASFLSSIDKKIEQLSKKDELLHSYKKGLMKKIFSQEIRFSPKGTSSQAQGEKDGSVYPDWEEKKLGELTKINQGLQIAISERYTEKIEESYFYITNEFLKDNSEKKYFIKNPPQSVICGEDDILMTRTGNTGQVVTNVIGAFHNNFFRINYFENFNKDFLVYFLRLESTQNMILRYAGTSTIPDLNHSDFYKLKINLPSIEEQTKIANFLSSIDTKISQNKKALEETKKFKKALLQQMFV